MDDIAVIIVNWNGLYDLQYCLSWLFHVSDRYPAASVSYSVWVVDNHSSDGSVEMVRRDYPQVNLIASQENGGFSKGNNQAIAASNSRYVFLLNSDAYVHGQQTLDALVAFGDAHPNLAIAGAHVLNPDGTLQFSCRRFPGLKAGLMRNSPIAKLFPNSKWAAEYLMSNEDHTKPREVGWVSGCAMLISRDFINHHGALDDRFFMYCEDVDICKRAHDVGREVWYCPDAHVTHKIGASSDKNAEKMIWEFHRSWELYYEKHTPNAPAWRRQAVKFGLWARANWRIWNIRRHRSKHVASTQPPAPMSVPEKETS